MSGLRARKTGSTKSFKQSLKKGSGAFIKFIPEDGILVRFVDEPDEWIVFDEYYDGTNYVPMAEGEELPEGARKTTRYLANAVDIENDVVVPLKMPKTLAVSLSLKHDKYGTLKDRDYELNRFGSGLDTTYDVTPEDKSNFNYAKYKALDLIAVLESARANALGDEAPDVDDDDDEDDAPRRSSGARKGARQSVRGGTPSRASSTSSKGKKSVRRTRRQA